MKELLRRLIDTTPAQWLLRGLERCDCAHPQLLRVLTYHQVFDARRFKLQIRHLSKHYHPVPVDRVLAATLSGAPLPSRAVLVTFDDAHRSFQDVAWPILRKYSVAPVLFVPSGFVESPLRFWWDRLEHALAQWPPIAPIHIGDHATLEPAQSSSQVLKFLKQEMHQLHPDEIAAQVTNIEAQLGVDSEPPSQVLSWQELRELQDAGVHIGAHTRSHPFMDCLDRERLQGEIAGNLDDLGDHLGVRPKVLAYPNGRYSQLAVDVSRHNGIELAFTTLGGTNDLRDIDPLRLRRINITPRDGLGVLQTKLLTHSAYFNGRRPLARHCHGLRLPQRTTTPPSPEEASVEEPPTEDCAAASTRYNSQSPDGDRGASVGSPERQR